MTEATKTKNRSIKIVGPCLTKKENEAARVLWGGMFKLAYERIPKVIKPGSDLVPNAAIRVLSQDAEAREYDVNYRDGGSHITYRAQLHDPRLLSAAVKPDFNYPRRKPFEDTDWSLISIAELDPGDEVLPLNADMSHPPYSKGSGKDLNYGVAFNDVRVVLAYLPPANLTKQADWPPKQSREIEYPVMRLVQGTVPIGIRQDKSTRIANRLGIAWPGSDSQMVSLFRGLCAAQIRKATRTGGQESITYVAANLVPQGIEFDVTMAPEWALPNGKAAGDNDFSLRVRLEADTPPGASNPNYRLVLIGGDENDCRRLRARFDNLLLDFGRRDSPLFLDAAPGLPPLFWRLAEIGGQLVAEGINALNPVYMVSIDPARLRASLRSEPRSGTDLPPLAALQLERATVSQDQNSASANRVELTLGAGSNAAGVSLALRWEASSTISRNATRSVGLGAIDTESAQPGVFAAVADTTELAAILEARYTRAKVLPDTPGAPLYAFLPLERGSLQLRLPADATANPPAAPPASVFAGLVRCSFGDGKTTPKAVIEVGFAERFVATVKLDRAAPRFSTDILMSGVRGTIIGSLWIANASPTPAEIIPQLEAGPAALGPLPIVFGDSDISGWRLSVGGIKWQVDPQGRVTGMPGPNRIDIVVPPETSTSISEGRAVSQTGMAARQPREPVLFPGGIAWLCYDELPLVAAIAMTRTATNALKPSSSRDLVPFRVDGGGGGAGEAARTVSLVFANGTALPKIVPPQNVTNLGWPWPAATAGDPEMPERQATRATAHKKLPASPPPTAGEVSLVPVTLPGVEYTNPKDQSVAFAGLCHSLRFDLPVLGELFAGVALKREENATSAQAGSAPLPADTPTSLDPPALERAWIRASERLTLTRTMLDRVTDWGPNRKTDIKTLVEPLTWQASFSVESQTVDDQLPLGRYELNDVSYHGSAALAGLTGPITMKGDAGDEIVDVTGFAIGLRRKQRVLGGKTLTDVVDTRGMIFQSTAEPDYATVPRDARTGRVTWRPGGLENAAYRYVTARKPTKLTVPGLQDPLWLFYRDLPVQMQANDKSWLFDGAQGPESFAGPTGDIFHRTELARAVYEWRLVSEGAQYSFRLGPLRFRPLRLHRLAFSPGDDFLPSMVAIIGTVSGPDRVVPSDSPAPGVTSDPRAPEHPPLDEQSYASGNLIALVFTPADDGLTLSLSDIQSVAMQGETMVLQEPQRKDPALALVKLVGLMRVFYAETLGIEPDLDPKDTGALLPFALTFRLALQPDKTGLRAADPVGLEIDLFGHHLVIAGQPNTLACDRLTIDFQRPFSARKGSIVQTDGLQLMWPVRSKEFENPVLKIVARAILRMTVKPDLDYLILNFSRSLSWLGARDIPLSGDVHRRIDHATGVIEIEIRFSKLAAGTKLVRGLPFDAQATVTGMAVLAVEAHSAAAAADTGGAPAATPAWPDFLLSAGFVEFRLDDAGLTIIQQITAGVSGKPPGWTSRLRLSAGFRKFDSRIEWPPLTLRADKAYAPRPDKPEDWYSEVAVRSNIRTRKHSIVVALDDVELPADTLASDGNVYFIATQWCFRAVARHTLTDGDKTFTWTSVEEMTLIDLASLATASDDTYAFAARYQESSPDMKSAGIGRRAFLRAGFPPKEILAGLGSWLNGLAASDKPEALVVIGGSLIDVVTQPAASRPGNVPGGVTLAIPWFDSWYHDAAAGAKPVLPPVPQKPDIGGELKITIAGYDLAAGIVQPFYGPAPVLLGFAQGSVALLDSSLKAVFGEQALRAAMVVDQAFFGSDKPIPDADRFKLPIFVRSLVAIQVVAGLSAGELDAATVIATATRPGRSLAVKMRFTALAEGSGRRPAEAERVKPPDDGTDDEKPPATWQLIVLARGAVSAIPVGVLPPFSTDAAVDGEIGRRAFAVAAVPLALVLAKTDERDSSTAALALGSDWRVVALPAILDAPPSPRPLRTLGSTLFASSALGWPIAPWMRDGDSVADLVMELGDERPIQDSTHAWAGRSRSFSGPAIGWGSSGLRGGDAVFFAFGRRVLYRRPSQAGFRAPPDRALTPVPPRARAPLAAPILQAMAPNLALPQVPEDGTDKAIRRGGVAPILPGAFEVIDVGVRAGVLSMQHDGYIATSGDAAFDRDYDRFGRLADRSPVVFRQIRAPRSTLLPDVQSLAERRRTFVAENELDERGRLIPFKLRRGPASVFRYPASEVAPRDDKPANPPDGQDTRLIATTVVVAEPALGRLGPDWMGVVALDVSAPGAHDLATEMAQVGFCRAGDGAEDLIRAEFTVGDARFSFKTMKEEARSAGRAAAAASKRADGARQPAILRLTLTMDDAGGISSDLALAKQALAAASADTPVALLMRFAAMNINAAAPAAATEMALATEAQAPFVAGPPIVLRIPLPRIPTDGPWVPVETATLAFGDPAYDRRLASPAQLRSARDKDRRYILAADRPEYDVGQTIHFAVGLIDEATPEAPPKFAKPDAAGLWQLSVTLQRKASPGVDPGPIALAVMTSKPDLPKEKEKWYSITGGQAYALPIAALYEEISADVVVPARIAPGDRLFLAARGKGGDLSKVTIRSVELGIVADPVIAPAEATYSLVTLDMTGAESDRHLAATPVLFATAPLAETIEFPDLLGDLALGHVRRRALFLWRFIPRGLPTSENYATLVKYDRSGGGQLPDGKADFRAMEGYATGHARIGSMKREERKMSRSGLEIDKQIREFSSDTFVNAAFTGAGAVRTVAALEADGDFLILYPEGAPPNTAYRIYRRDVTIISQSFSSRHNNIDRVFYNVKVNRDSACTMLKVGKSAELLHEFPVGAEEFLLAATLQISISFNDNGEGTLKYGGKSVQCLGKPGQAYPTDQIIENIEGVQYEGDYGNAYKFQKWVSSQFPDSQGNPAVMLWSVKIDGLHGIFIHEDPDTLASNGGPSQGCIHLASPNAKNFYDWITARTRIQISYPW